jgi:hypothetical protein
MMDHVYGNVMSGSSQLRAQKKRTPWGNDTATKGGEILILPLFIYPLAILA